MRSPGATSPPSDTTAMTPALKRGPGTPACSRSFNPALKRSMRTQGVRRPVSLRGAEASSRSTVPRGRHSRSSPIVVMFSPEISGADVEAELSEESRRASRFKVSLSLSAS